MLLLVGGWCTANWRANTADRQRRAKLLNQVTAVARTINPDLVKSLSFTAADKDNPAFQRLCEQMAAFQTVARCRGIYTLALRDGNLVFGPESYAETDPQASVPGSAYEEPPLGLQDLHKTGHAFTYGPYTDEYGTFVSAYAPVLDPRSGAVLMSVGLDIEAADWQTALTRVRLVTGLSLSPVAAIVLGGVLVLRRRNRLPRNRQGWSRCAEAYVVAAFGVALTIIAARALHESETRSRKEVFSQLAEAQADQVRDALKSLRTAELGSLARFYEDSENVRKSEFRAFAAPIVQGGGLHALAWAPAVPAAERTARETQARAEVAEDFAIWQRGADGQREPAAGRDVYYAIWFSEPSENGGAPVGYDLGSGPVCRAAIEKALATGLPTATDALPLVDGKERPTSVLVFHPVFSGDTQARTLRGFALAVVHVESLLQSALSSRRADDPTTVVCVHQLQAGQPPRFLASSCQAAAERHRSGLPGEELTLSDDLDLSAVYPGFAFGNVYAVVIHPGPAFLAAKPARVGGIAVVVGLLLTAVLAAFAAHLTRRHISLETQVLARTAELRESGEHLRATLRSIGDGVISTDAAGTVSNLNTAAETLTGWTNAEAKGRPIAEVLHIIDPQTRANVEIPVGRTAAENRIIARDGTEHEIANSCAPIHGTDGQLIGAVFVFREVTEEQAAQERIKQANDRFNQLAERSGTVHWEVNAEGVFTYVSHVADVVLGYPPAELVGAKRFYNLHPEDGREAFKTRALGMLVRKETFSNLESPVQTRDGRVVWISTNGIPVLDDRGMLLGYQGSSADITERKQAELELRSRMAEVERFNRMALRREHRVIELKQKVNELSQRMGQPTPYPSLSPDAEAAFQPAVEGKTTEAQPPAVQMQRTEVGGQDWELAQLVDLEQMQRLLDSFCRAVGVAAALIDLQGKVLIGSRWQRICTDFHRVQPQTLERCIESDTRLANQLLVGERFTVYQCCNGLTDAASPVTIAGRHVANAFVGQFLLAPPDEDWFRRRAAEFGFEETAYLEALRAVPIVQAEKLPFILDFLVSFAQLAATMGLERLQEKQAEAQLAQHTAALDARNRELDRQREAALSLAEDAEEARITAEKSEEALRQKTAVLEAQVNSSLDGILVIDGHRRRLLVNQRFLEICGIPPHIANDEADGPFLDHIVGMTKYPEQFPERVTYLVNNPHETGRDEIEFENGLVLDRYSAPVLGKDGQHYGRIWTLRDITERKRAEEALRASETRLQGITDSARDAILMMDSQGTISYWNPAAESILGYQKEEAIGQNLHRLLAPERYHGAHQAAFPEFVRTGHGNAVGKTVELVARRKDGQEIAAALSLSGFLLNGAWHAVGILRDITEQKRAEKELLDANRHLEEATARANELAMQAEAANRAKSDFLANMSHEIRTPMTAILGFADVILECANLEGAPQERMEAARTIKRNGEYLLEIINDILDLSKIEVGRLVVERIACSPSQIVMELESLMRVRSAAKGLELKIEYEGHIPETIQSDPTRLRQILINLLGNAIRFTETGSVRLITRLAKAAAGEPVLEFDTVDTGLGMTDDQAARIFQPFSQADTSTTRRFGGSGLGLTISKRLAKALGGDVTLISTTADVGSRFRLTIPTGSLASVKLLENPTEAYTVKPAAAAESQTDIVRLDCRILLAEDGPDNQRLIAHFLKQAGAAVTVVENGQLAIKAGLDARDAGQPYDVILMDMQMPVLDGYQAAGLLREKAYTGPIIALTAHAMASDREKCLAAGCNGYATKPIDRTRLLQTIREQLDKRSAAIPGVSVGDNFW